MQRAAQPRVGNVPGQFFTDSTCIDCDVCRWMAPQVFTRVSGQSSVTEQPADREGRIAAMQALLSCPTVRAASASHLLPPAHPAEAAPAQFSIHMRDRDPAEFKAAQQGMPIPVAGCPGVHHCGYHSEKSFSAASYFIARESGNVMVDCPRFNPALAARLEALGGVQHIVLSHMCARRSGGVT